MPEIVVDHDPFQMPEAAREELYAQRTPPSLGSFILSKLGKAPSARLGRAAERGTAAGSSAFDQGLAVLAAQGGVPEQPLIAAPEPAPSPEIPPEQYNELYAPRDAAGKIVPIGDKPMPQALAEIIGRQKSDEMQRDSVLSRFAETHSGLTTFLAGTAASMLDPFNAGSAFLPGIGEGALAARLGGGIIARTVARLGAGAATGAAIQAPVSGLEMALAPEEASDYGMRDALRDIAYSAVGVAALHTGLGTLGELLGRGAEAAKEVPAVSPPVLDAATQNAAMRSAIGEIADGRPVDVAPAIGDPAAVIAGAERQAEVRATGWAPTVSQDEMAAANDAVYGRPAEERAAATAAPEAEQEMALAEQRLSQLPPEALHPEDRMALAAADEGVTAAEQQRSGFDAAAACLMGAG